MAGRNTSAAASLGEALRAAGWCPWEQGLFYMEVECPVIGELANSSQRHKVNFIKETNI